MKFTVVWLKSVQFELGEIWLSAADRHAVTAASDEIDRQLQQDADHKGRLLSEGLQTLDVLPLRAVFSVDLENRIVEVSRIRLL